MPPPHRIDGIVQSSAGSPVAGARVYVTDSPLPVPDVAALTDADGRFSLTVPASGAYTVACTDDTGNSTTAQVSITDDAPAPVTLQLP